MTTTYGRPGHRDHLPVPGTAEQPAPKGENPQGTAIWKLVIEDMHERDRIGRQRYGVPLQANNGRDALVDAYQEALDLAVYLRQAIEERRLAAAGLDTDALVGQEP